VTQQARNLLMRLDDEDVLWGAKTLVARLNRPVCSQIAHSACATRV
jgi:hypothetical protein